MRGGSVFKVKVILISVNSPIQSIKIDHFDEADTVRGLRVWILFVYVIVHPRLWSPVAGPSSLVLPHSPLRIHGLWLERTRECKKPSYIVISGTQVQLSIQAHIFKSRPMVIDFARRLSAPLCKTKSRLDHDNFHLFF